MDEQNPRIDDAASTVQDAAKSAVGLTASQDPNAQKS